jgi:hypothetical protein
MTRWLLLIALGLPAVSLADGPVLLLISEDVAGDEVFSTHYWWHCAERETQPLSDRIAARVRALGSKVVDRCSRDLGPIHKTYRKAQLRGFERTNLGGALGAGRVLGGHLTLSAGELVPDLGLHHVHAMLTLDAHDLERDVDVGSHTVVADGFDADPGIASDRARELILAQLWPHLPQLAAGQQARATTRPKLHVARIKRPGDLDAWMKALAAQKTIRQVTLLEVSQKTAVLAIEPPTALEPAARWLRKQGADATVR